jgi:hypothetical protein
MCGSATRSDFLQSRHAHRAFQEPISGLLEMPAFSEGYRRNVFAAVVTFGKSHLDHWARR